MNERLKELHEQHRQALAEGRRLRDEADKAEGSEREEKIAAGKQAVKRAMDLNKQIEDERQLAEQERRSAELAEEIKRAEAEADETKPDRRTSDEPGKVTADLAPRDQFADQPKEVRTLAQAVAAAQGRDWTEIDHGHDQRRVRLFCQSASPYVRKQGDFQREVRALQADSDIAGGYTVPGPMFIAQLIKAVDDATFMRQFGTYHPVNTSDSLGAPALDNDPADADWNSEIGSVGEDSTMTFGARELKPRDSDKLIKVSEKWLRVSALPAESLVRDRMSYKLGITHEKAFLTGSTGAQPLGIFTASASGISTGRDVSTDNTTTAPTFDNAIRSKYTLKGQYWSRARWVMHRDVALEYALVKSAGDGPYIWRESVRVGEPDRLLGFPVSLSEYAPNTLTTGLYVAVLGDLSHYWIAENVGAMYLKRLDELYAATKQVGFIIHSEVDGMPVLEEAFVRVKLA